jgi:hypothetical protein
MTVSIAARNVAITRARNDNQNDAGFLVVAILLSCGASAFSAGDTVVMVQKKTIPRFGISAEKSGMPSLTICDHYKMKGSRLCAFVRTSLAPLFGKPIEGVP